MPMDSPTGASSDVATGRCRRWAKVRAYEMPTRGGTRWLGFIAG